jgi:hypothetical protein
MDEVFGSLNYAVKGGQRYAFSFVESSGIGGETLSLAWMDDNGDDHFFVLADGTTTESTAIDGGWEFVAPTNRVNVFTSSSYKIALVPIVI